MTYSIAFGFYIITPEYAYRDQITGRNLSRLAQILDRQSGKSTTLGLMYRMMYPQDGHSLGVF